MLALVLIPTEPEAPAPPARDINDLTASELAAILKVVNDLFPLPTNTTFRGKHHFQLNDQDELELRIWYRDLVNPSKCRIMTLTFDDDDMESGLVSDIVSARTLVDLGIKLKDGGKGWTLVPRR